MRPISPPPFSWQSLTQFLPSRSTIRSLVNAAVRPAAIESVRRTAPLIRRGIKNVRALRIHGDVAHSRVVIYLQDLRPRFSPVRRLVNAALRIRPPQMPQRRHVQHIRISRMNHNAPNVTRCAQPHVLPSLSSVQRFIGSVAPRRTLPIVRFARPHPHHRRIRWCDSDVADRRYSLLVENRRPRGAIVGRLPNATRSHANKHYVRIALYYREVINPPAHHRRADLPQLQVFEFVDNVRLVRRARFFSSNKHCATQPCGCCPLQNTRHSLHDPLPHRAARHHTPLFYNAHLCFWNGRPVRRKTHAAAPRFRRPLHNAQSPC